MRKIIVTAALMSGTALAYGQSMTIYGIIDIGGTYANNQGGAHSYQLAGSQLAGSRLGFRGSEDLGNGLKTIFVLENGFDPGTGQMAGGAEFARMAYVGLTGNLGTLTLGKQYDFITDFVQPYTANGRWAGLYFAHPNDVDRTDNGVGNNNAIKFTSADYGGFKFGGFYSFGGQPGRFADNSLWSLGVHYTRGSLSMGAAYLRINDPSTSVLSFANGGGYTNVIYGNILAAADSQSILALGGAYVFGRATALFSYTHTRFASHLNTGNATFQNVELAGSYSFSPAFTLILSDTLTIGKDDAAGTTPKYNQFAVMASYAFSKRTSVYAQTSYQLAFGDATQAQITGLSASSTNRQVAARIGILHFF